MRTNWVLVSGGLILIANTQIKSALLATIGLIIIFTTLIVIKHERAKKN